MWLELLAPLWLLEYLLEYWDEKMKRAVFIEKGEAEAIAHVGKKIFRLLFKSERMEGIIAEIEEGETSEFYRHEGEELHILLKGTIDYQVGDEIYHMHEGDMLWHESDIPHRAINVGNEKAVYITISTPPTFM